MSIILYKSYKNSDRKKFYYSRINTHASVKQSTEFLQNFHFSGLARMFET